MAGDRPTGAHHVPGKRLFDLVVAGLLAVLTAPVMAVIGVLVRRTSEGPAFHRAVRVGLHGRHFTMFKFRSMRLGSESGSLTTGLNDPRVTPIGRVLRRTKLDELPQPINVLKGDMSLVGPRPEVVECVQMYTPEQREILDVRPGITDLSSVHFIDLAAHVGEGEDPHSVYIERVFDAKNALRLEYARGVGWRLDLKILLDTALSVFGIRRGVTER